MSKKLIFENKNFGPLIGKISFPNIFIFSLIFLTYITQRTFGILLEPCVDTFHMKSMKTFESPHIFTNFEISHADWTLLGFFIHSRKSLELLPWHIWYFQLCQTFDFLFFWVIFRTGFLVLIQKWLLLLVLSISVPTLAWYPVLLVSSLLS